MTPKRERSARFSCCLLILSLACTVDAQHRSEMPVPPPPAVREDTSVQKPPAPQRIDILELEREARELSALAGTVPADMELLRKGLLPRDAADKLKRIEKLAKHIRGKVQP